MRIDPEDLRRHYELLSDGEFLNIDRSDLVPMAQGVYDQEIERRGLDHPLEEEEAQSSGSAFAHGEEWAPTSELGDDDADGPPPAWMEEATCAWSTSVLPNVDYVVTGAEVQSALRDAGIPNRIVVKDQEPEPASTPPSLYCVMVPGDLGTRACAVIERKVFNRMADAEWRSQLETFSDEELRALNPEDLWGALLEKAENMKRAYLDEIARRKLRTAAR